MATQDEITKLREELKKERDSEQKAIEKSD